jgi:DMSO reductase family type II enzyme heme b subunit
VGPETEQIMGHDGIANIWQWLADRDSLRYQAGADTVFAVRELIAAGAGTQSALDAQNVTGRGAWRDGHWMVAFRRALEPRQEGELALLPDSGRRIAFAVWDGAKRERFGIKSISVLRRLRFARSATP